LSPVDSAASQSTQFTAGAGVGTDFHDCMVHFAAHVCAWVHDHELGRQANCAGGGGAGRQVQRRATADDDDDDDNDSNGGGGCGGGGAPKDDPFDLRHFSDEHPMMQLSGLAEMLEWLFQVLRIEPQCAVVAAVYIQRARAAGVTVTRANYEPLLLAAICLASKVVDDLSTLNEDFVQAAPHYDIDSFNRLEHTFVGVLEWNLNVSRHQYSQFYMGMCGAGLAAQQQQQQQPQRQQQRPHGDPADVCACACPLKSVPLTPSPRRGAPAFGAFLLTRKKKKKKKHVKKHKQSSSSQQQWPQQQHAHLHESSGDLESEWTTD
jgi:hypothetical protein